VHLADDGEGKGPLVEALAADAEGVLDALVGAGGETVEGHRDLETQSGHASASSHGMIARPPGSNAYPLQGARSSARS
jgi:hypothetical protein